MRKKKYSAKAAAIVISCSILAATLSLTGCTGNNPEPIKPTKPDSTIEETSEQSSTKEDSTEESSTKENGSEIESSTDDSTEETSTEGESSQIESSEEVSSEEESRTEENVNPTLTPTSVPVLPPTMPPAPINTPVPTPVPTSTPTPTPKPTNTPTPTPTPKPHVHEVEYIGPATPTCQHAGHNEYYKCTTCGKYFYDYECEYEAAGEAEFYIEKVDHDYNYAPFRYPNCDTKGCKGYYYCDMCDTWFWDYGGQPGDIIENHEDAFTPAYGHSPKFIWAEPSTCTRPYVIVNHYECTECGELFLDIDCEQPTTWEQVYSTEIVHDMLYMEEMPCSISAGIHGQKEHWECGKCGNNFYNSSGTIPASYESLIIHGVKAVPTSTGVTYVCPICGKAVTSEGIPLEDIKG